MGTRWSTCLGMVDAGYSVCLINLSQNRSAGGVIPTFFKRFRIDIDQPYIVRTYPGVAPVPGPEPLNN